MTIELPDLPWAADALAPHISEKTINYHYGKHHAGYVKKLNAALSDSEFSGMSLEQIVLNASGALFNNAAQIWNHTFYWNSLSPNGGGDPSGKILDAIVNTWGSFDAFKQAFTKSAATNFGSGWTWLVKNSNGALEILNTPNAECPITDNRTPILTIDIWEHAYYIDYKNDRSKYIDAFWSLVNWDFANDNLQSE